MTIHSAVDAALEGEKKSLRFYDEALEKDVDGKVRSLFEDLRAQEQRHREILEQFKSTLPEEDEADPDDYVDEPKAQ